MSQAPAAAGDSGHPLTPYVPRLEIEWLRDDASARHRAVEGTLAFVDISGFTSMTERLARKGKVGAEEMSDTLNACFSDLLSVAYDFGAGLVKWGGDAVLLWFEGREHAARACRSAIDMQRAIVTVGRIKTSVGQVRLRMSVGIHSGKFDFFLTGDPAIHRELVIAGPASTHTVLMEQIAEAGEVAVSDATAALLDPQVLRRRKEEAWLLGLAPEPSLLSVRPGPDAAGLGIESLVPAAIREYLLSEDDEPEHRRITAAFLEFSGTDDLLAREGATAAAEAIDTCIRKVQTAAFEHDVGFFETDVARNAWRVMLIAGAPRSPGADEDRMLDTVRAVVESELPLPVRVGTNGGHVFAGRFGPPFRKTYSVKGDAVNLAARLMAKAEPGQILATASVLEPAAGLYELAAIAPFTAKGKRKPVEAWSVGRRVGSKTEGLDLPLVGRDPQLRVFADSLARASIGLGSAIEIVGAPGIGKTRLLQELTRLAPEFSTFRAFCEPHQQQIPYRPFRAIIRAALAIPKDAAPAAAYEHLRDAVETAAPSLLRWLPLLGIVADIDVPMTQEVADLGEEFRRRKLEETAVEFLTALFAKPTIVELEDVHWLDEPSTALLARIVDAAAQQPWVVAVTRRAEATGFVLAPGEHRHPLVLAPLQPGETEELIAAATHERPFRRHDVEALTTRSAGNPLFLSQLLKVALESGSVDSLPLTVESLVTAEIDRLSPADRRVLRVASVLGMAFPEDLLVSVLEAEEEYVDPRVWDRLGKFLYAEAPGRRRFRHALMRDAAYEGLPFGRRRGLHARAGVLVISDSEDPAEHAELLSFHFFAAQSYFDSWAYSKISGERALAKFANVDAAAFFSRALESGKRANIPPPQLAAVHEQLGDVRLTLNEFDAARAAYAAGRRLVPDDRIAQGRFLLQEAKTHYRGGRSADAIRSIRRGMRLLEDDHSPAGRKAFARLAALYAGTRVSQGRSREAERWCRRIIEESDGVGELEALARAYYILDLALMEHGRVEEVVHSTRSAELYEQLGDLSNQSEVISNSGGFAYLRGRWDEAFDLYGRALELRRRVGDDAEAAIVAANMAEIRLDQGRLDEAQALLAQAGKAIHAGGYLVAQGYLAGLLGRAAALAGRLTEALDDFSAALNIFERTSYRTHVFEMHMRIADALVLAGEPEAALEEADEALVIASELGGIPARLPSLHRIRASAFVALDQVEDARAALEQSLETARARLARHEIGLTLDALVKLDRLVGREPDPAIVEQSQAILAELDLVRVPELPALETTLATSR